MSGDQYVARVGAIGLAASTTLCLMALKTGTARPMNVEALRVSSNGGTAGSVYFFLARITNTPVGTGTVNISIQDNAHATAAGTTGQAPSTANPGVWTTPPTAGAILWEEWVPIGSGWSEWWPGGMEVDTITSDWIGVFANASVAVANTTAPLGAYASVVFTE